MGKSLSGRASRLERASIAARAAQLPFKTEKAARGARAEMIACGAEQVVTYVGGPAKIRYNSPPLLTCRLALALARFEELAQEQAALHLGHRIVRFTSARSTPSHRRPRRVSCARSPAALLTNSSSPSS